MMLGIDAPVRRSSLRPGGDYQHTDRRRSSFRVTEDFHLPPTRLNNARQSITSNLKAARRVSNRSQISSDSFELSDYRGSFSIYSHHQQHQSCDEFEDIDSYSKVNNENDDKDKPPDVSNKSSINPTATNSYIYQMIPVLSISGAVICLILNVLIPGLGTIFSGCIYVCYNPYFKKQKKKNSNNSDNDSPQFKNNHPAVTLCVNFWVGLGQLATVTFLLVGWFWSLAWGIYLVNIAVVNSQKLDSKGHADLQKKAIRVLLTDSGAGGAITSGMMGINTMFKKQQLKFGVSTSNHSNTSNGNHDISNNTNNKNNENNNIDIVNPTTVITPDDNVNSITLQV